MYSCTSSIVQERKVRLEVIPCLLSANEIIDSVLNRERQCSCPRSSKPKTSKCCTSYLLTIRMKKKKIIMFWSVRIGTQNKCIKNFISYLILKLWDIIFSDCYFKSYESNANSLRVKNIQCSYLGISSHTLDPSTCHMATWYSQVMDFAVWCLMKLEDIPGLQKLGSSLNTLSIHMKQLKCTSASINNHFKGH